MSDLILVRPSEPETASIARLSFDGDVIRLYFPEPRTSLNDIVKSYGYGWKRPYWTRTVLQDVQHDRAAELAAALLAAGYCVKGPKDVIETAVAKTFTPEPVRTICRWLKGDYADWFSIWWHKDRGGDLNAARRGLRGSRWANGRLMVPAEQFEAVMDFASVYNCCVSPGAQALADEARAEQDAAIVVDMTLPDAPPLPGPPLNGKPKKLDVPEIVEVDNDLLDDE